MNEGNVTRPYALVPRVQPLLSYDNTIPPVSATWYTAFTGKNIRLITLLVRCDWTVQPVLDVKATIDGNIFAWTLALPTSAQYYAIDWDSTNSLAQPLIIAGADNNRNKSFVVEGKSLLIEVKRTGGTCSAIYVRGLYAKW